MPNLKYYSNGKLLLTGEYLILDGALGLALPTRFGQDLKISIIKENKLVWESYNHNNLIWFKNEFYLPNLSTIKTDETTLTLIKILKGAQKLNSNFLDDDHGFHLKTKLSFPNNWGLGSSSTLINNIANWAQVNAFELLDISFGGSGYDIACANNAKPIQYQLLKKIPRITPIDFNPDFAEQLYFIYLNKKQSSKEGIKKYKSIKKDLSTYIDEISQLTKLISHCNKIEDFNKLLVHHECIISSIIKQEPVQNLLFKDYFGQTKSLGAWGGDFILATGNHDTPKYFIKKGFETVIAYRNMIL